MCITIRWKIANVYKVCVCAAGRRIEEMGGIRNVSLSLSLRAAGATGRHEDSPCSILFVRVLFFLVSPLYIVYLACIGASIFLI